MYIWKRCVTGRAINILTILIIHILGLVSCRLVIVKEIERLKREKPRQRRSWYNRAKQLKDS